ncbi:MAG: hypothetical protein ABIV28_04990 [Longimicrobiales bacterium]
MSTQWVNTLPDLGALHALLQALTTRVAISDIDELWIFPTRRIAIGESTVVVLSMFDEDPERRRVLTARFTVSRDKKGVATVNDKLDEYGTAPLDAVARVVDGVVRRLGEEIEKPPRREIIDRSTDAWLALLIDLGAPRSIMEPDPVAEVEGGGASAEPQAVATHSDAETP